MRRRGSALQGRQTGPKALKIHVIRRLLRRQEDGDKSWGQVAPRVIVVRSPVSASFSRLERLPHVDVLVHSRSAASAVIARVRDTERRFCFAPVAFTRRLSNEVTAFAED